MEKIAADSKDDFFNDVFWSSSEYKDTAWYWYVGYYSNDCSLAHFLKSDNIDVRPVLAF